MAQCTCICHFRQIPSAGACLPRIIDKIPYERAEATVNLLFNQYKPDTEDNALIQLLYVLRDFTDLNLSVYRELLSLIGKLKKIIRSTGVERECGLAQSLKGIPPDIYRELRETLLKCGLFQYQEYNKLNHIFENTPLKPWANMLPVAEDSLEYVLLVIDSLFDQFRGNINIVTDDRPPSPHENALILFLQALNDLSYCTGTELRELIDKLLDIV